MIDVRIAKKRKKSGGGIVSPGTTASGSAGVADSTERVLSWIRSWLVPVDADGNELDRESTEEIHALKAKYPLYSVDELSAYGFQEGGTGTGGAAGIDETVLQEYLKTYAKKTDLPDLSGYALKSDIPAAPDLSGYALKSEIPSLAGYATQSWVLGKNYLTAHQDISGKVDKVAGYGLSKNDFTDTLLSKLNGIEAGANKYTHPTATASTITTAKGRIISAITVNALGHVTSVSHRPLEAADIPALSISAITNLQDSLDAKLNASVFNELFEKITQGGKTVIKAKYALYSVDELSAYGFQEGGTSGTGTGVGINETDLAAYLSRNGYATQSWVNGRGFLTTHQSLDGYARLRTPNDLVHDGNEVTFISDGFSYDALWFNWRAGASGTVALLKEYKFGNATKGGFAKIRAAGFVKDGGTASQALMADGSTRAINIPGSISHLGWAGTSGQIATIDTLAFWNGLYVTGNSNLQYCDRGRFGTMATASASDYLPLTGGTLKNGTNTAPLIIDTSSEDEVGIRFRMGGVSKAWAGYSPTYGAYLWNAKSGFLGIRDNGHAYVGNDKIWHEGNDGNGSGLDADLLDGLHLSAIFREYLLASQNLDANSLTTQWVCYTPNSDMNTWGGTTFTNFPATRPDGGFCLLNLKEGNYRKQLYTRYNDNHLYIRNTNYNKGVVWSNWSTVALTSDNVASASKLANTRTIWGQYFNGEENVSGNLSSVGDIYTVGANGRRIECNGASHKWGLHMGTGGENRGIYEWTTGYDKWLLYFTNSNTIINHGNVGIATDSPTYKLDVNGTIRSWSNITADEFFAGTADRNGDIQIYHATPYIDFHFNRAADKTCRIIEIAKGSLRVEGNLYATGELAALTGSDLRLKTNIRPVGEAVRRLRALGGYSVYDYLPAAKSDNPEARVGLIAQRVQGNVGSLMLRRNMDGYLALNYLQPDYINLIGASVLEVDDGLTKARRRIKALEEKVRELEKRGA